MVTFVIIGANMHYMDLHVSVVFHGVFGFPTKKNQHF